MLQLPLTDDKPVFKLTGVNNALAKNLFCSTHDHDLFRKVESTPFVISSETALLLHFRGICNELYSKLGTNALHQTTIVESDGTPEGDAAAAEWALLGLGQQLGLKDVASRYWRTLDWIQTEDFTRISYLQLEFSSLLPYAYAGAFVPEVDFKGRNRVDLSKPDIGNEGICATAFSAAETGFLILTWEKGAQHSQTFASSLLQMEATKRSDAGLILGLEHLENSCFAPTWWESLSAEQRQVHEDRLKLSATANEARKTDTLVIDGNLTAQVPFSQQKTNDGALFLIA